MKQRDVIKLIVEQENGKGRVADLRKKIGEENFDEFCLMGLIKRGVAAINDEPVQTWAMTDSLQKEYDFYFEKLTEKETVIAKHFAPARFYK